MIKNPFRRSRRSVLAVLCMAPLLLGLFGCTTIGGGSISMTAALTYKSAGSQSVAITLSGSGEVKVSNIWLNPPAQSNFYLEGESSCERVYKSSSPECTFKVVLSKYEKGAGGLVFAETGAGTLETFLSVD